MSFIATLENDFILADYILGDVYKKQDNFNGIYEGGKYGISIATNRYFYLDELEQLYSGLKIACKDPNNDYWTKWEKFPGALIKNEFGEYGLKSSNISAAIDVHRSILPNEIVIESDYPTYEENYEASKIIGAILEHKGFTPHYYYSGNKSLHIHIFLDFEFLNNIQNKDKFMEWLRSKMISCWDIKAREFDEELIRASHLIRAELSKNKKGFKTFLGYTHKDLSFIPYICNENNRIYPRLAKIKISKPEIMNDLMEEFEEYKKEQEVRRIAIKKNRKHRKMDKLDKNSIRLCVKSILRDDFKNVNDGF